MSEKEFSKISICEIYHDKDGNKRASRIGDIENGIIIRFLFNEEVSPYYENRRGLHLRTDDKGPDPVGSVAIWKWDAWPNENFPEKDHHELTYLANKQPIEVFEVETARSDIELKDILLAGINFIPCCKRVILYYKIGNGNYRGIFFKDIEIGKEISIPEDTVSLPICEFTGNDIFVFQTRQRQTRKVINDLDKQFSFDYILTKEIPKIVKDAFLKRASWPEMKGRGLVKKEWQQITDFVKDNTNESLYSEISTTCRCSIEDAKRYVDDFISNTNTSINIDIKVLEELVKNNKELKAECEKIVEKNWKEEHQQEISKKQSELDKLDAQKETLKKEAEDYSNTIKDLKTQIEDLLLELEDQEKISNEVKAQVRKRIEDAQKDVSEFVSSISLYLGASGQTLSPSITPAGYYNAGDDCSNGECEDWEENIESIDDELAEAGVCNAYRSSFAAFLYASYIHQASILLMGPNGESIANAFSTGAFGKMAGILDCSGGFDKSTIQRMLQSDDPVVIIKNPFAGDWITEICNLLLPQKKMYFLVTPFSEDILIEPASIFNYALPIMTEGIVSEMPKNDFFGKKRASSYKEYRKTEKRNLQDNNMNTLKMSMFLKNRVQGIITDMHQLDKNSGIAEEYLYALVPYAYATDKGSLIREAIISDNQIDKNTKNVILNLLGMEE